MSATAGCGCGGASVAAATSAGGCGCEVATTGAGFTRPRFFGGMLLTEDDLQAAVDYAAAKRRLTNRHVLGAGVVCGLEVTCHPCDRGKVSVSPGYAIECCGNDIVVSCKEDVDIIALVRDLRLRKGVDCAEPCTDQPRDDYDLYVRYAETPTAPVAPYATQDCATGECEFSRIAEGYCFELRWKKPDPVRSILDALGDCQPQTKQAETDIQTLTKVVKAAVGWTEPVVNPGPPPQPPSPREFAAFPSDGNLDVAPAIELLKRAELALALFKAQIVQGGFNEASNAALVKLTADFAARVQRYLDGTPETSDLPRWRDLPPDTERSYRRVLDAAATPGDASGLDAAQRALLPAPPPDAGAEQDFLTGAGRIRTRIMNDLLGRGQTTCGDYQTVSQLRFAALNAESRKDTITLADAYLRCIAGCVAAALHPPCATCTDDAVMLARVSVDRCDVVSVCPLERRWVSSPRALAYWFPVVETFREIAERMTCEVPQVIDDPFAPLEAARGTIAGAIGALTASVGVQPEFRELLTAMGREAIAPRDAKAAAVKKPTLAELQDKLDELVRQVDDLAAEQQGTKP